MNSLLKKSKPFLFGFMYVLLGASPIWADDTEIYFGSSTAGTRNNILFVIDTSGSMGSYDGDSTTRMQELKSAFKTLLQGLDNVNVGLMRFSNPGGPVLYPVSNINEVVATSGIGSGSVSKNIQDAADDGFQLNTTGVVDLSSNHLSVGTAAIGGAVSYTFSQRIAVSNDDAYSWADGRFPNIDNDELVKRSSNGSERVVGLRFNNVTIPKSTAAAPVTIDSAYLRFTVSSSTGAQPVNMTILGEAVSGPGFSTSTNGANAANRVGIRRSATANILSNTVSWGFTALPANGAIVDTPDLTDLIKAMINDAGWTSGKAMTFFYERSSTSPGGDGSVNFASADANSASSEAPVLVIKYHIGTGTPTTYDVTTALRYTGIDIPRGATITGAHLEFNSSDTFSDMPSWQISAEKVGNSAALTTANFNITGRTTRTSSVAWNNTTPPALGYWSASTVYPTPELKSIVQEVVSQSTWCGGNAMTFFVTGTGQRLIASRDEGSSASPKLVITYDPNSVPTDGSSCLQASFSRQISAGTDDAEEDNDTSAADLTSIDLDMAASGSKIRRIGLRFTNITIPKNAQIQSAYLQFHAAEDKSSAISLSINGQAIDDAPTFVAADNNISDRAKTSAVVAWNNIPGWTSGNDYRSPDVSSIVQELVNRSGWAAGNDMAFIIDGTSTSATRVADSYNGSAGNAAKLIINYVDNGTSSLRTVRNVLLDLVDNLEPNGNTPLQDTFYEGVQYFRGQAVDYGKVRGGGPYSYTRVSHPKSMVDGTYSITPTGCQDSSSSGCKSETIGGSPVYKSPITYACQSNHIVLLTDGLPNSDHSKTKIRDLPGFPTAPCSFAGAGECVPELATWVNKTADISSSVSGTQHLIVDTIAFYQDADGNDFLDTTASNGGGQHLLASSNQTLVDALEKITTNTISENASFVAAGAAVNAFNRTLNRDDLYFSVFKPEKTPKWPGNLKKYKLKFIDDPATPEIVALPVVVDADSVAAVDSATGFFKSTARSIWSAAADGPDVTKGGAGALITDYTSRHLYTNVGASNDLSASENSLISTNTNLTKALFGASAYSDTDFTNLVDWTRGKDVKNEDNNATTTTRFVMADPLHSRPVAITYGGTEATPDITVFVASNGGALHAVDDDNGQEVFAFIPKELLPLQKTLYENVEGGGHAYGLDGSITTWVIDPDGDGLVLNTDGSIQTGNKVILIVGMGRGGRNYYALDVTNRAAPKLLWTIKGGVTTGFEQLGQTWAQPEKARITLNGVSKRVLILGGGYDPHQDTSTIRVTDSQGAAVYMVDLLTGALVWRGGKGPEYDTDLSDMNYGIPAQVTSADVSGDGLADFFFVGDMGGQVWRFDIHNDATTAAGLVTAGVIADLGVAGGSNTAADNRRFYHSPALFLGKNNGTPYLGVTIGSGWRGHPLSEDTSDAFMMIRQTSIFAAPSSYTKITKSDLFDVTDNVLGEGTAAQQATAQATLATKQGWYLSLPNSGEKVLSTPLVVNGEVFFTTYEPGVSVASDPCSPQTGTNRSYQMFVADARPSIDRNADGLTKADRSIVLLLPGIASSPVVITTEGGTARMEGPISTLMPTGDDAKIKRIYWYENRARN